MHKSGQPVAVVAEQHVPVEVVVVVVVVVVVAASALLCCR